MVRVIGGKIICNKNYLELAELRFESVRVKIQNMYVGNPGVISRLWFELSGVNCTDTENGF